MLKTRVIPVVLIDGYSVLKTIKFDTRRNLGNPITVARIYNTRNVDELILLDIDASKDGRMVDYFTIREYAKESYMPLTVGGGIRSIECIRKCLTNGADKVSINSIALEKPEFISEAAGVFGSQCIVVSIDIKKVDGKLVIHSHSGQKTPTDVKKWFKTVEELGAGEILVNLVDHDGEMDHGDVSIIEELSSLVNVPVIFAGGIAAPEDCTTYIKNGATAVAASSIFHFTRFTPSDCRANLNENGIEARNG